MVGSGTGYSAARVLAGARPRRSRRRGDRQWLADKSPYDLILLDGAVEEIPAALAARLGPDGRLGTGDRRPWRDPPARRAPRRRRRLACGVSPMSDVPVLARLRTAAGLHLLSDGVAVTRHLLIGALAATLLAGDRFGRHAARGAGLDLSRPIRRSPPSARALKATDAGVAIARSAGRPTVTGTAGLTRDITRSGRFEAAPARGRS